MRHGPHHGAQKSTISGRVLLIAAASNCAVSVISTGTATGPTEALQLPQRVVLPSDAYASRFGRPQLEQVTMTPVASARATDITVAPGLLGLLARLAAEQRQQRQ